MEIVICTTPIRPTPTDYPPFGSMAIIQSLRSAGYDPYFYDIDGLRPSFEEVERFFSTRKPDVLGISAVVSTAYSYTKKLALMVKRVSPKTRIVLGGNLAASAEICHRLARIDYCVAGEGESVAVNLMNYLSERVATGSAGDDYQKLKAVRGISFIDPDGHMTFTGYEAAIPAGELFDPDYTILQKYSRIENYISDPATRGDFPADPRTYEPHRRGKRMATLITAKGCVARCTFCHRWDKGYRALSVARIVKMVRYLQENYNVGFIQFGDENFGSDRRQVNELLEALAPLDILFNVAGVRCRTVDPDLLRRMKAAGCVSLFYGMETGSPRILQAMEKNASLEHNLNAALWTQQAGLFTIYQLVLGMPGESAETISETIEFFKKATEVLPEHPGRRLSINYIQALPGTPVYENARKRGMLGKTLEDEERYLELISDTNAADDTKFLNFTDTDLLTVQSWRRRIILECIANYWKKNNVPRPTFWQACRYLALQAIGLAPADRVDSPPSEKRLGLEYSRGGYFNLQASNRYDIIGTYFYPLRTPIIWSWLVYRESRRLGLKVFLPRLWETLVHRVKLLSGGRPGAPARYQSLRKIVDAGSGSEASRSPSEIAMAPLRAGR